MSTYSLTLRNIKGSALTYQELDNNFLYLENQSANAGSSGTSGSSGQNGSSGTSGISGSSGTSGDSGSSGTSGLSGSSGTSGLSGSSGTSGIDGSSGTSGTDGSSGTSGIGINGSSGTSGQNGSSGTSGSGGSGAPNINFFVSPGQYLTHNQFTTPFGTTLTRDGTLGAFRFTAFVAPQTMTINSLGLFLSVASSGITCSFQVAIYDSITYSVPWTSNSSGALGNLVSYYPQNRLTAATISTSLSGSDITQGAFMKSCAEVQLIAGQVYFCGGYATMSSPGNSGITVGLLNGQPNLLGFITPNNQTAMGNMTLASSGTLWSGTASAFYPYTSATFSLPLVMPNANFQLTHIGAQSPFYLPMRIKSIP